VFDAIIAEMYEPSNFGLGKLYSVPMYRLMAKHLSENGYAVIQSTSPYFAPRSFWCIDATLKEAGFHTWPYHAYVPSFGEWGYILASREPYVPGGKLPPGLRFVTPATLPTLFNFPPDMARVPAEVNRLNNQLLVRTFEQEWKQVLR